jgi:thiol-disulfide isomerase/thioredoxin
MNPRSLKLRPARAFLCAGLSIFMAIVAAGASRAADAKAAPEWSLKDVNGKAVKSSDFAGKVVVLDFWATWCPPCKQEIPGFIDLQKKYGEKGLVILGVSLDEGGPEVVKPFIKEFGINYPIVMGDEKIVSAFGGIEGIPTTFIINRKGEIVAKHVGFRPTEAFEKEITPLL